MGINSRIGVYYGLLIDQYMCDPTNQLTNEYLENLIDDDILAFDGDEMNETTDFCIIYVKRLSKVYGDHSNAGNYAMTITKDMIANMVIGPTIYERLAIESVRQKIEYDNNIRLTVGFHTISFMD